MNLSPNFTKGTRPKIGYIIHGTLGNYAGAVDWLCTPPEKRPVVSYSSAHYVIAKDGRISQLVADSDVAWHAGNVSNPSKRAQSLLPIVNGKFLNPNESFIGIELEWFLGDKVTEAQYLAMIGIIRKGGIVNPIIMCHKEVTDYKADFQTPTGAIDFSVNDEIMRRLGIQTQITPEVKPALSPEMAAKFVTELNAKFAVKDYKGAKDSCSLLFTELVKLL